MSQNDDEEYLESREMWDGMGNNHLEDHIPGYKKNKEDKKKTAPKKYDEQLSPAKEYLIPGFTKDELMDIKISIGLAKDVNELLKDPYLFNRYVYSARNRLE